MEEGLVFLINQKDMPEAKLAIKIQKKFIHHYVNSVLFPHYQPFWQSTWNWKESGSRTSPNFKQNKKHTFFAAIPFSGEAFKINTAAFLFSFLLPGPSPVKIGPFLKELSRHCAIIAISRTLQFCLQHDVYPDFVVQLDTFLAQKHFYEKIDKKLPTTLISLSISPIISYLAQNLEDYFSWIALTRLSCKNNWRLREKSLEHPLGVHGIIRSPARPPSNPCRFRSLLWSSPKQVS